MVDEFDKTLKDEGQPSRLSLALGARSITAKRTCRGSKRRWLTLADVQQFHDTHYRPDDMIIVMIAPES